MMNNANLELEKLLEIAKWSDKSIEWNTNTRITASDIWQRKEAEELATAVKKYVRDKIGKAASPQEFIDALANETGYNPLAAGAIVNALMYGADNTLADTTLDTTKLQKPLDAVGLGAKGGRIYVNGNVGQYFLEKAENTRAIIEGNVGHRAMGRSKGVRAFVRGNVGEQYGWQSTRLYSIIKGDITGVYAFAESENAQACIAGKILKSGVGISARELSVFRKQK